MKAATITNFDEIPQYGDFQDPENADTLIHVKAAALENFDKAVVSGKHFASQSIFPEFPAVVGHSGVGTLQDGTMVSFRGPLPPFGAMAEKVVVSKRHKKFIQKIPKAISPAVAAALPAAAATSYLNLKYSAQLQKGQNILINGATGVSGKLAVQIAKLLGANQIIGTGRHKKELGNLDSLGVDKVIDLSTSEEVVLSQLKQCTKTGIDVILDFIWGRPAELILQALTPKKVNTPERNIKFIQIGQAAGESINLKANMLRTSGIELKGITPIKKEELEKSTEQIWQWTALNKLSIDIEEMPLKEISSAWKCNPKGKRIVIIP